MTRIISVDPINPEIDAIKTAVDIIRNGGVIVYPTDTVYGLGANALDPTAILQVFTIKQRSRNQPLPVAVSGLEMAERLSFVDDRARRLMEAFWPGALTIIVTRRAMISSLVVGGGTTVGLRMPRHSVPLMIIRLSGLPLTATSANKHRAPPPREAQEVLKQLGGEVDLLLDCGRSTGCPSTIIDVTKTPPLMVRNGPVTREMIEEIVGPVEG